MYNNQHYQGEKIHDSRSVQLCRVHNIYREESIELPIWPSNTLCKVMMQSGGN